AVYAVARELSRGAGRGGRRRLERAAKQRTRDALAELSRLWRRAALWRWHLSELQVHDPTGSTAEIVGIPLQDRATRSGREPAAAEYSLESRRLAAGTSPG